MISKVNSTLKLKFKSWLISLPAKSFTSLSSDQTLISLLKSCSTTSEITQIHGSMIKTGLDTVPFPLSKLLAASVLNIGYASTIFKYTQNPNQFMFNTMLRAYSISNNPKQAFDLFNQMRSENVFLDEFTFVSTLKSCSRESAIWFGCGIHSLVVKTGFDLFVNVRNTLLQFYGVGGRVWDARQLFDEFPQIRDLVSWNSLMGGHLIASRPVSVLDLFRELYRSDFVGVSVSTVLSVLRAVGDLGDDAISGPLLHGYCVKTGFCLDLNVVTALISMYGKTGWINSARRVFDEVSVKDVVMWNCLMDGYAKSGLLEEALALLRSMELEGVKPNSSTLVGLLSASRTTTGGLKLGQIIHYYVERQKMELDAVLGTALVDMYSKCGLLDKSVDIFNRMVSKDVKCWTAMISAYGVHGQAENAIMLFNRMEEEGYIPNEVTFLALLSACSHGGLVMEGIQYFQRMVRDYGLRPKIEHYGCIADLLGRAGLLEEAYNMVKTLPIESDATAWRALLAACRTYGNVDMGECVQKELDENHDFHPADSITLSSTYAVLGRMRKGIKTKGKKLRSEEDCRTTAKKEAGCSSIELTTMSEHIFVMVGRPVPGDRPHWVSKF